MPIIVRNFVSPLRKQQHEESVGKKCVCVYSRYSSVTQSLLDRSALPLTTWAWFQWVTPSFTGTSWPIHRKCHPAGKFPPTYYQSAKNIFKYLFGISSSSSFIFLSAPVSDHRHQPSLLREQRKIGAALFLRQVNIYLGCW